MEVVVGEGAAAEVEVEAVEEVAVGEEVAVEEEVAVPGRVGEGGGGGLAVVVLCSEQLMILTETSNRTGSVELQDTISFKQLLQEKAGMVEV